MHKTKTLVFWASLRAWIISENKRNRLRPIEIIQCYVNELTANVQWSYGVYPIILVRSHKLAHASIEEHQLKRGTIITI